MFVALVTLVIIGQSCASPQPLVDGAHAKAAPPPRASEPKLVRIGSDIVVNLANSEVVIGAQVAARIGWLEQLVCKAGTREHESLLAVEAKPKLIHAALLAAGITHGSPGEWIELAPDSSGKAILQLRPPTGSPVEILVRWKSGDDEHESKLCDWVRRVPDDSTANALVPFPCNRFVFAGSRVRPNPPSLGPGEHYVADYTGSIVGLVTFGDEVIAFEEVIPDRVDIAAPLWEAWTDRIPPEGTPVDLVIRPRRCSDR